MPGAVLDSADQQAGSNDERDQHGEAWGSLEHGLEEVLLSVGPKGDLEMPWGKEAGGRRRGQNVQTGPGKDAVCGCSEEECARGWDVGAEVSTAASKGGLYLTKQGYAYRV